MAMIEKHLSLVQMFRILISMFACLTVKTRNGPPPIVVIVELIEMHSSP